MAEPLVTIELDAAAAERAMQQYPTRTERAVVRSLNRALTSGRAEMARRIAKDMGLKVGDAKDAILSDQASVGHLAARLVASSRRRPLMDFQARQTRAGVTFRGLSGRQLVPHAFIVGVQSGHAGTAHTGVFLRVGKARLPIRQLFGVSIGEVFDRHRASVIDVMRSSFETNLAHELAFADSSNG